MLSQAPKVPEAPREQLEAVVRVGCALRALARCYLPIYPATIMDTFEVRWGLIWPLVTCHGDRIG